MKALSVVLFLSIIPLFGQQSLLRDTTNLYDYVIITTPQLKSSCQSFKQHKENVRNFRVLVVDTSEIYNEFNTSSTKENNIREFISYAGKYWRVPKPKYFLIAGTVNMIPNFNIPPMSGPVNEYAQSDYYYTQSIYESDSITTDFFVGRVPAKNTAQLQNYFTKVIEYESNSLVQPWMNRNLFICEENSTYGFIATGHQITSYFPNNISSKLISNSDTSIYFGNKDTILNYLNNVGSQFLWIESSSNDSVLISGDYFSLNDLSALNNGSKYFITISPQGSRAIIQDNTNLTNELLFLPNNGSIGGIVSCGVAYWNIVRDYQNYWAQKIFASSSQSLFEIFKYDHNMPGFYDYQRKILNVWGDPSLVVKVDITVDAENQALLPANFILYQNFPNPFNPTTAIRFSLPVDKNVTLKIYDILGNEVASLLNDEFKKGSYEVVWDGTNNFGSKVSSGTYIAELRFGNFTKSIKMTLLK